MRNTLIAIVCITLVLTFTACGPVPLERLGLVTLSVSAQQKNTKSSTTGSAQRAAAIHDDQFFKEDRKEENRGTLLHTLTPETFIINIDDVVMYNTVGPTYLTNKILPRVRGSSGTTVPQHYDLVHTTSIIRDRLVQNTRYDGFAMRFLPGTPGVSVDISTGIKYPIERYFDKSYLVAMTGVKLPEEYDNITLNGEVTVPDIDGLSDELRYFGFHFLQPIETNDGFLSYLIIGSDVKQTWIQNPTGAIGRWKNPVTVTTGNAVALYLSSSTSIDISAYKNPKIVLHWDMNNLIEIYDNGTENDYSDDIITFNVKNPFPVSLVVEEDTAPVGSLNDTTAPSDVALAALYDQYGMNTLQWINPQDADFKEVVITRKIGGPPSDRSDGEEVYRSHIPNFVDWSAIPKVQYFYLIQTVDYSGNYSPGVIPTLFQP